MKKTVACLGQGFVGGSLTTVLAERGLRILTYDIAGKVADGGTRAVVLATDTRSCQPVRSIADLIEACEAKSPSSGDGGFSGIYFVCLPTPMLETGECDTSIVEGALAELSKVPGNRIAVIKSTVPPGSTERWNRTFEGTGLRVVFNPEFLREATAIDDMRDQTRIVLGGPRPHINRVKQLFETAFPNVPIIKTSSTTAEMVKYVTNVHLAVKVSLANELYQVCEALDKKGANIDYDKVIEYATLDERLGKSHWKVPGPMLSDDTGEPMPGFSGSCMPKDVNALKFLATTLGVDPKVMTAAWEKNLEVRPQRDWEKLIGRAVSKKTAES